MGNLAALPPSPIFRWLGAAGVELSLGDRTLLIDPFFTRAPLWNLIVGRPKPNASLVAAHLHGCQTVLVTHAHFDHLMDVPEVVRQMGAHAYGSPNTCRLLHISGIQGEFVHPIRVADRVEAGPFQVEVFQAGHARIPFFSPGNLPKQPKLPLRLRDYRMDDCFSYLVEAGGMRILDWAGETTARAPRAEVLCVGVLLSAQAFGVLLDQVRPRLVIPIHWDNFFQPLQKRIRPMLQPPRLAFPPIRPFNFDSFRKMIAAEFPTIQVLQPGLFQPVDLVKVTQSAVSVL